MRQRLRPADEACSETRNRARNHALGTLQDSLEKLRAEVVLDGGEEVLWKRCLDTARDDFRKAQEKRLSAFKKGLLCLFLLILCVGLFVYFCKPASFYLQRKLHSNIYPLSRCVRKVLLFFHPYFDALGVNIFSSCVLRNPFIHNRCLGATDIKEWSNIGHTLPKYVLEGTRNGELWILRSAITVKKEVTVKDLQQFSIENSGHLPNICEQIVGGGEDSKVTAFYTDIFNEFKMKEALKSPLPWSLSWVECPDQSNWLSIRSLFPPFSSILPDIISTSTEALISFSTEWCTSFHYQNGLPSTLLSFMVVRGEVTVIPVILDDYCQEISNRLMQYSFNLKQGDAVLLDHQYWSYEVQTWSNYSITVTSSIIPSDNTNDSVA